VTDHAEAAAPEGHTSASPFRPGPVQPEPPDADLLTPTQGAGPHGSASIGSEPHGSGSVSSGPHGSAPQASWAQDAAGSPGPFDSASFGSGIFGSAPLGSGALGAAGTPSPFDLAPLGPGPHGSGSIGSGPHGSASVGSGALGAAGSLGMGPLGAAGTAAPFAFGPRGSSPQGSARVGTAPQGSPSRGSSPQARAGSQGWAGSHTTYGASPRGAAEGAAPRVLAPTAGAYYPAAVQAATAVAPRRPTFSGSGATPAAGATSTTGSAGIGSVSIQRAPAGRVQRTEAFEPSASAGSGAAESQNPEQLAEAVFERLRWRLSVERERTFG
jgi:hypothetical protein